MQFNNKKDLKNYPTSINEDIKYINKKKVDIIFIPKKKICIHLISAHSLS